ncbi:putative bifunctional diguanylate cyclase/phosphodiesterase [Pseudoduganella namucuonensis]|uniref:PAS domain S-box-containing protein/diguanylate cyclase (GGDEF) domain-containing protein n=1 Tax=Pseudoduganella namucuonensis TaxID=1035707 RepID=A0A1I7HUU4_9BURK|nr:EAL domain-containing protein [Pseudoduganella namucuonensis]SFU64508.1 PAS domain S-box-containing protein/diguanylate cyclase (GGDEF) domain-containing protein [Pseudoduganella namucuonensis]
MDKDLHATAFFAPHVLDTVLGDDAPLAPFAASALDAPGMADYALNPERLRHEQEQAYFNDIYLLAPVGYYVLAFDTTVLQMNLVGADLLGLARENPGKAQFRHFIAARFLPDFDVFVRNALNSATPLRCDLQMTRGRPGEQGFPVTLRASADGSGQACRVMLELAEGKQSALERSEERFRRIVHSAEEGIWEIDSRARTSFVNPKMAQMLGYAIEEMLDQPLVAFMDDEGRAIMERNIARRQQGIAERHEFKFMRKDGKELWTTLATNPIFDNDGVYLGALALVTDITASRQSSELIWRQANFDALTGLPNRHMLHDRLAHEMKKARREGLLLALLFIDLDQFKQINDKFGHEQGDALLVEAAARITACVRASDTLARLGGDEFVVIVSGLDHVSSAERVAQHIIAALARPFELAGDSGHVSASVGIAFYPSDASEADELLRHADQAMYAAKSAGRNRYNYFTPDLQQAAQLRQQLTADLRCALAGDQFELYYQPIVNLGTGMIERAEALLRWRHPQRGLLHPQDFIACAEASGLFVEIGDWVFRRAAEQVQLWQRELGRPFQVSVNQSPAQFRGDAAAGWMDYVDQLQLAPRSIVVDITEGILMNQDSQVLERLRSYRAMGLQVALDDFGTGYGSLAHLRNFDIDFIKIDRSFVRDMVGDSGDLALCEALIVMAHKLGLKVVAEGVETRAQQALLAAAGCDYAQGYVFAHAVQANKFAAMARNGLPRLP